MRKVVVPPLLVALVASLCLVVGSPLRPAGASSVPPQKTSRPGQISVIAINAYQALPIGKGKFDQLFELGRNLRQRPLAFDGGPRGAMNAPDVIVLPELRYSNAEILKVLLKQRFPYGFDLVGNHHLDGQFILNNSTVERIGEPIEWGDACLGPGPRPGRSYHMVRLKEKATGAVFTVVNIHFAGWGYSRQGHDSSHCLNQNVRLVRSLVDDEPGAVIVAGDFNQSPVEVRRECDPQERSPARAWWTAMTDAGESGREFTDAARFMARRQNRSMARQWTYENRNNTNLCTGQQAPVRTRLDYIFTSGVTIAHASADDPGWAGAKPGTRNPSVTFYSDHRWVEGRFILGDPARPGRPETVAQAGGAIQLTWEPVEGAKSYIVLRGVGTQALQQIAQVGPDVTTYRDAGTTHGRRHRYAIAVVRQDGGHGWESLPGRAIADGRGPRVIAMSPRPGSMHVSRRPEISARFDENVVAKSVRSDSIVLRQGRRNIGGRVIRSGARLLTFKPSVRLKPGARFTVIVNPVADRLGNRGARHTWSFTTRGGS